MTFAEVLKMPCWEVEGWKRFYLSEVLEAESRETRDAAQDLARKMSRGK